jgi:Fur family transcriptional regulator, ferric uptake regulator
MESQPQRSTRQRQIILEELRKVKTHPTAVGVYEAVRKRLPKISLGTVYRNLDVLVRMGQIQKLALGGEEAHFDGDVSAHHHIRCMRCGRIDDIYGPLLDLSGGVANDFVGYEVLGYHLEYVGVCPECRGDASN